MLESSQSVVHSVLAELLSRPCYQFPYSSPRLWISHLGRWQPHNIFRVTSFSKLTSLKSFPQENAVDLHSVGSVP